MKSQKWAWASPRSGITDGFEPPCGRWESNSGLLEEKPEFLNSEPPLQILSPDPERSIGLSRNAERMILKKQQGMQTPPTAPGFALRLGPASRQTRSSPAEPHPTKFTPLDHSDPPTFRPRPQGRVSPPASRLCTSHNNPPSPLLCLFAPPP